MKMGLRNSLTTAGSLILFLMTHPAFGEGGWVNRIPNGNALSCTACHTAIPAINTFGSAFNGAGQQWTVSLANQDSDGDSFSNGQELGDPQGTWTQGNPVPIPGAQVTNPGQAGSVPQLVPPSIAITSPAPGSTHDAPFTGPLTATSTNPAPAITQVEFFADANPLGMVTTAPYSLAVNLSAGQYSLTARATDYLGAVSNSAAVMITVASTAEPPVITTQPASQTVSPGADVTFMVEATGTPPLSYQWRKDAADLPGATSAMLALNNVQLSDAGTYTVVVSNSGGDVVSDPAVLTFLNVNLYAGLTIVGPVGAAYRVDYTVTLEPAPNWIVLTNNLVLPASPYQFVDWGSADMPRRFYRAVPLPAGQ